MMSLPDETSGSGVRIEQRQGYLYVEYFGTFDVPAAQRAASVSGAQIRMEGARWKVVSDFRRAKWGDAGVIEVVIEATRLNAPYVERAAVIDEHSAKRFIAEHAARESGRTNVRVVGSLDDAEAWVVEGHEPQHN